MVVSDIPLQVFGKTPQISPITHSLPLLTDSALGSDFYLRSRNDVTLLSDSQKCVLWSWTFDKKVHY